MPAYKTNPLVHVESIQGHSECKCRKQVMHLSKCMSTAQALPFLIETPSQKAHKTSLERRLQEIEEANKVFSRTKVLVEI